MTTGRTFKYNLKDGKTKHGYTITLSPPDPRTGQYPQVTRKGYASERAAKAAMLEHIKTSGDVDSHATTDTVEDWLQQWFAKSSPDWRPWTEKTYHHVVHHYLIPHIGRVRLDRLAPAHIEAMYDELAKTLKQVTIHRIHRVLKTALRVAVREQVIPSSPIERVDAPERRSPRRPTLSVPDAFRLLDWMQEHRPTAYQAAYLALYTGMRQGEVAGLQWCDVDLSRRLIQIERTRQRVNDGKDTIGSTKTDGSQRRIIITQAVAEELAQWKARHETYFSNFSPRTYVVQMKEESLPAPVSWTTSVRLGREALELPSVSFHDLRHTHATWLLESGVDLKTVSERLGHSSITITADTYGHVTDNMQRHAMDKLETLLSQNQVGQ